jgi:futalosine hydrolase
LSEMAQKQPIHVAVLGAVPFEIEPLFQTLGSSGLESLLGQSYCICHFGGLTVLVGTTGFGKVNGAITTAALLERYRIESIWNIGCAGASPDGPLRVGDVLVTQATLCGDEGVLTQGGIQSCRSIGIPLVAEEGKDHYDAFALNESAAFRTASEITPSGRYSISEGVLQAMPRELSWDGDCFGSLAEGGTFQILHGPSLTVGMTSGDPETARKRFEHYRAFAENMEASAIAQTCLRYGVPMLECRGMSNVAGDRDKSRWRLRKALDHCHGVVRAWLAGFSGDAARHHVEAHSSGSAMRNERGVG